MRHLYVSLALLCATVASCNAAPPAPIEAGPPPAPAHVAPPRLDVEEPAAPATPPPPPVVDPRTPGQIALAACSRSDGSWACPGIKRPLRAAGAPSAAQCGPACTVSSWYIDPQNSTGCASDNNSCTSATCGTTGIGPCSTFAQIVGRLGSPQPIYPNGQSVTFNLQSSQTAGSDPIFFEPYLSGGGQAILTGLPYATAAGASFSAGALSGGFGYSGATPSAGGTQMVMASVPGYVVSGVLLQNTTRSSYAFVDSVAGGNASLTQPQTSASITTTTGGSPSPTVDNDWTAGDTIKPLTLVNANLNRWEPKGGEFAAGGTATAGWVLGVAVNSLNNSATAYFMHGASSNLAFSCVLVNTRLSISGEGGRGETIYLINSLMTQSTAAFSVLESFYGGALKGGLLQYGNETDAFNNVVLHGTISVHTIFSPQTGSVFSDGTISCNAPGGSIVADTTMWGSYGVNLQPGCVFWNATGSTFAASALLTNGSLKLYPATTGSSYSAGVWTDGVSITPANLDSNNGLQNPRTGARFTNGT